MARASVRAHIAESINALKVEMQEGLTPIVASMVDQLVSRMDKLPAGQLLQGVSLEHRGVNTYWDRLKMAFLVIAEESLAGARAEVPKASKVKLASWPESIKLGQWENLPGDLRKRLGFWLNQVVDNQMNDLDKVMIAQYGDSVLSTDSQSQVADDLEQAGETYVDGASVTGAASKLAAGTVNEARTAFFTDDEVLDQLDAFEFVNADPVSEICQDLAGTVFAKDDPNMIRYTPPLHFNCKSYISPILAGKLGNREIEKLKPSKASLDDQVQFSGPSCGCWHDPKADG